MKRPLKHLLKMRDKMRESARKNNKPLMYQLQ